MPSAKAGGLLSSDFVLSVYVPSIVVLSGVYLAKRDLLPVALAIIIGLAGYKLYESRVHPVLKPKEFQKFPLTEKTVLSHNTAIYRFKLPKAASILGLPIGQHISVKTDVDGEPVMRSYTPITSDDDLGHFDLLIKSYPTGRLSKHFGEMNIGDTLDFAGPKGNMIYTPNMKKHIGMIAGGTGITPMWQIITAILKGRPERGGTDVTEVDLLFANVGEQDILMKKELDGIASKDKRFRVHYVLNNPPEGWKGGVGFVTGDMMKAKFPPPANDTKVLLCGPPPMIKAMKDNLEKLGYEKARAVSKLADQVFAF